jgi:S-adenosyl methyltransferase
MPIMNADLRSSAMNAPTSKTNPLMRRPRPRPHLPCDRRLEWPGVAGILDPAVADAPAPSPAGVYNYWLGGSDHRAADRATAGRLAQAVPQLPWLARENRRFLSRAVKLCAGAGITQFLDIGSGLPATQNVHQAAGQVTVNPHVVYADKDPAAVTRARALLPGPGTAAICADLTRPDDLLSDPELRHLIDFSKPVAILLSSVLHLIPDAADPAGSVARLRDAMAPGSYLLISHFEISPSHQAGTTPLTPAARELSAALHTMPATARTREQITGFLGDLTLLDPGLVDVWAWRPDTSTLVTMNDVLAGVRIGWHVLTSLGCVGRKDHLPHHH